MSVQGPITISFRMGGLYHGEVRIVAGSPDSCTVEVRYRFPLVGEDMSPRLMLGHRPWAPWLTEFGALAPGHAAWRGEHRPRALDDHVGEGR